MRERLAIAGSGGQGIITLGELLCRTGARAGLQVAGFPTYGAEKRGGRAGVLITIADEEIAAPVFVRASAAIALDSQGLQRLLPMLLPGGRLLAETTAGGCPRTDIALTRLPAAELGARCGGRQLANVVMLGAWLRRAEIVPRATAEAVLTGYFAGRGMTVQEQNHAAFAAGWEASASAA